MDYCERVEDIERAMNGDTHLCEECESLLEQRVSEGRVTLDWIAAGRRLLSRSQGRAASAPRDRDIFVSYVREDADRVDRLVNELEAVGHSVWLDRKRILAGQRWADQIRRAIQSGACFVACFSERSEQKGRSYMREELEIALDEVRLRSRDTAWFIPVKLGRCDIPDAPISARERLSQIHYVDLSADWARGVRELIAALAHVR